MLRLDAGMQDAAGSVVGVTAQFEIMASLYGGFVVFCPGRRWFCEVKGRGQGAVEGKDGPDPVCIR